MKIKITGNRCIGCYKYSQYYTISCRGELEAIDCGYCGVKQCRTRPGNRCKEYREKSNVGLSEDTIRMRNKKGLPAKKVLEIEVH